MSKSIFITFEGIDGTGKSTQALKLCERIKSLNYPVLHTREPGGTRVGRRIREILLDPQFPELSLNTEVLLYAADRAQHVKEAILPALEKKWVVICERYIDSSVAYQAFGLGLDRVAIQRINQWATDFMMPDITICLDLEPEVALTKVDGDRIEQRTLDYYKKVRQGYHEIANESGRFNIVDAEGSIAEVHEKIFRLVKRRL